MPAAQSSVRMAGGLLVVVWALLSIRPEIDLLTLAWVVLAVASFFVARSRPSIGDSVLDLLRKPSLRAFLTSSAIVAAVLSYLVLAGPVRDRPQTIDANVYLFQARALSHLHLGVEIPEPRELFGGRFLFEGADRRMYGVFPPGYPLFLVPFVWLGAPMLAGPVTAVLLVLAQWLLGRAIEGEDGVATRLAIVASLPGFARALETADLMSHAFVAALGATAIALALLSFEKASIGKALAIGAAIGWAAAARFLDGVVLGAVVGAIVLHGVATRKLSFVWLAPMAIAALPFVALVLVSQKAATGSYTTPTQFMYFARSDWPPTCHRLGFGWDVGCAVEHEKERASFGPDGYGFSDAFHVVRLRTSVLGIDLFGLAWMPLAGFAAVAAWGRKRDALLATTAVAFTCAYGLFYYGNAAAFGARHLFAIAPVLLLLVARAAERVRGASIALLVTIAVAAVPRWFASAQIIRKIQNYRVDLRGVVDRSGFGRGMFVTGDEMSWIAAFDPVRDGDGRVLVRFDGSGLKDLRRTRPDLTIHSVLENEQVQTSKLPVPPPGLLVELERGWPSFVRRTGDIGFKVARPPDLEPSGERYLFVFHSTAGASISIPFYAPKTGRYALRVDGLVAPDYGTWSIAVDGAPLGTYEGWAEKVALHKGEEVVRDLSLGDHTVTFTCIGKRAESAGYLGGFDALIGTER